MTSWDDVLGAATAGMAGRSDEARQRLETCWDGTNAEEHAQRCVLAHYLADQQPDLAHETSWDERALLEHSYVADADLIPVGVPSAAGFGPSLHLNLADDYLRAGNSEGARVQLTMARQLERVLPEGGYGAMIRSGLDRLEARLDTLRRSAADRLASTQPEGDR